MKAIVLAAAFALALAAPAGAASKPKKAAAPADTMSDAQQTNDASWRLVKGSLPIWLPSWAQPIYQTMKPAEEDATVHKSKKVKRKTAQKP